VNRTAGAQAVATTNTVVASLSLPAGSYLLYAKANVVRTGGNGSSECSLLNGATVLDLSVNQGTTTGEVVSAHGLVTLATTTTINYSCRVTNGSANVSNRTLSAVAFSALTVQ
jgi:hypothetical protein